VRLKVDIKFVLAEWKLMEKSVDNNSDNLQLVDLKAELLRKQEESRQQKLQNATNRSLTVPKVSLLHEY